MVVAERAEAATSYLAEGERVTRYAHAVVGGSVVAGRLVRLACERHLRDLERADPDLRFDAELAGHAISFFPVVLRHYKGEWGPIPGVRAEGLPIDLEDWEAFIVGSLFGWLRRNPAQVDAAGHRAWIRRFRKAFVEIAKKNGKTLLAAGIGLLLAFVDDEPGAEVYSAATKKDQAKLLWRDGDEMVLRSPALSRRIRRAANSLFDPATSSFFKPISSEEGSEEGINPHGVIVDEVHRHKTRGLIDMLANSFGARTQPLFLEITTAGDEGEESIWAEEHGYAAQVIEQTVVDDATFVYIATLDADDDPFDEAVWPKANPNLGVSVKLDDLRSAATAAQAAPGKRGSYLRFRMNLRTARSSRFMPMDAWRECDAEPQPEVGADAWGGLDLGWSDDLSAFALWIPSADGHFDWIARLWAPEHGVWSQNVALRHVYRQWADDGYLTLTDGDVRDDDRIFEDITELVPIYNLRTLRYDRAMATNLVARLYRAGVVMEQMQQGLITLSAPTKELERLTLKRLIRHGGHPVLTWMAGNLEVRGDDNGNLRPTKPNKNSTLKIDGMSAGIDAIAGWLDDQREDLPEASVWEQEGRSLAL